jgi:hypothetical protein
MPTWAAIVVGVASGLLSGTLGTLFSIAHERGAESRTRQLDAAAAFLRDADQVRRAIRRGEAGELPSARAHRAEARWEDLAYRTSMIELLFDRESVSASYAQGVVGAYRSVINRLQEGEAAEVLNRGLLDVGDQTRSFTDATADAARDSWLRRRLRPRSVAEYLVVRELNS